MFESFDMMVFMMTYTALGDVLTGAADIRLPHNSSHGSFHMNLDGRSCQDKNCIIFLLVFFTASTMYM